MQMPEHAEVKLDEASRDALVLLADLTARGRTPVARDHRHEIEHEPSIETPGRLIKQLQLLAAARARLDGRDHFNERDLALAHRVAFDSIAPASRLNILRRLLTNGPATPEELGDATQVSVSTRRRVLGDLVVLGLVEKHPKDHRYAATDLARRAWDACAPTA